MLFADLVGFTPLSEARDAEEVRELLSEYFVSCQTVIGRYGGTVDKFIGDAVMAVWGVPVAHEDDAERAVRAGLDLIEATATVGERMGIPGLAMRVGIVTGEVAVSFGATSEGLVAGDAVNTAARIQTAAAPGQVWVDDATRSLTSGAVAYADAGEHALKGKTDAQHLYRAQSVVASVGGHQRIDGLEARIVGRDAEVRLVRDLFHTVEETGRARLVLLSGEAGVGKSRVAWEFEKYVDGLTADVMWHRGRCLSYGDGVAFWALSEAVRGRIGLVEADRGTVVHDHVNRWLERSAQDEEEAEWLRPRLLALLGEGSGGTLPRDDLFAAWTAFFDRVGGSNPVVLVIDDAQHADDGLVDFVEHLLSAAQAPIFVLALSRPEILSRRPELTVGRRTTVVHLEPLNAEDMAAIVDDLVDGLPASMRDELVTRADGIPLFAVETVRALIDRDLVVPVEGRYVVAHGADTDLASLQAPASLQALVASRLDALSPTERRVVTDASVLGMSFTREGIGVLAGEVTDLDAVLDSLRRKEILTIQTDHLLAERGQFRFVQSVVQQVAYATQGRHDRKDRHLAVAEYLAGLPDPGNDLAVVIAQNLLDAAEASGNSDPDVPQLVSRAQQLLIRAAQRALALGSPSEALDLFRSALEHTEDPAERARLMESASHAALDSSRAMQAVELARSAAAAWESLGDDVGAGRAAALAGEAGSHLAGDPEEAVAELRTHWDRLSDRPGAEGALLPLAAILARLHSLLDDHEASRGYLERQVRVAEAVGDHGSLAAAMLRQANILSATGAPVAAAVMWQGIADFAALHDLTAIRAHLSMLLATYDTGRDANAALARFREALDLSTRVGSIPQVTLVRENLGLALWTTGRWHELWELIAEFGHEANRQLDSVLIRVLDIWKESAVGGGTDWPPLEHATQGAMENAIDLWVNFAEMERCRASGNLGAATRYAEVAVTAAYTAMGLEDDFALIWPAAVTTAVDAGDLDLVDRLMELVDRTPSGLITPIIAAQHRRLSGMLGIARGAEPAVIETALTEAVAALEAYGAVPDRALTEATLGRWLIEQGRPDDADRWLVSARATMTELGAHAWLSALPSTRVDVLEG